MPRKPTKKVEDAASEIVTIEAFKAFDPDLKCRGFQYEVGKTYEHSGHVAACSSGFHACENPFDILSYYPLIADNGRFNRFAKITQGGTIARHSGDSKIASGRITIDIELHLPEFVAAAVNWIIAATKTVVSSNLAASDLSDSGKDDARIGSSGNDAQIGSSGYAARIGSSGNDARIGSSGNDARIGSSGNAAQIGSSGYAARIGSSGNAAQIGSSGYAAQIGSSGNDARIDASGKRSVIASAGINTIAKGADGTWLSLAEFEYENGAWICLGFATGCIGKDGLKADTFYRAKGGKLVEIK